jgi:hypothetical protein
MIMTALPPYSVSSTVCFGKRSFEVRLKELYDRDDAIRARRQALIQGYRPQQDKAYPIQALLNVLYPEKQPLRTRRRHLRLSQEDVFWDPKNKRILAPNRSPNSIHTKPLARMARRLGRPIELLCHGRYRYWIGPNGILINQRELD